jgi:hypothetical protein
MKTENLIEEEIKNIETESQDENKRKTIKTILEVALFTLGALLLTSCSPAKADGQKEQTSPFPSYTPMVTATFSPIPSPTATPSPTPSPTPEIPREKAISMLNLTSNKLYSYADLIVHECTLRDGTKFTFFGVIVVKSDIVIMNPFYNEIYATFTTDEDGVSQVNYMDKGELKFLPEFLQGATVDATYGICDAPYIFEMRNKELPKTEHFDYIIKYMSPGEDHYVLLEENLTAVDCANMLLDLYSYDEIAIPRDLINENVPAGITATPKQK